MPNNNTIAYGRFEGIVNNTDSTALGASTLQDANNIFVTKARKLQSRKGISYLTDADAIFSRRDNKVAIAIINGVLHLIQPEDNELIEIGDVGIGPYYITDADSNIFIVSGNKTKLFNPSILEVQQWGVPLVPPIIANPNPSMGVLPAGNYRVGVVNFSDEGVVSGCENLVNVSLNQVGSIQVYAPDTEYTRRIIISRADEPTIYFGPIYPNGIGAYTITDYSLITNREYKYFNVYPPINGQGPIAYHMGRIYQCVYDPIKDFSEVYCTRVSALHMFEWDNQFTISEMSRITALISIPQGLVVCTNNRIKLYDLNWTPRNIVNYGVPPGENFSYLPDGNAIVTTNMGIRLLGTQEIIRNPNEDKFLTDFGSEVGGGLMYVDGEQLYITCPINSNFTWIPPKLPQIIPDEYFVDFSE